ncbi:MAG: 2-oxoacid:acceptor oxidoreductase family protein [Lewinellaceae bacterium]|nr:2-oxoacid:acceptor oxidoreductase family protein [Phaeodactylibacter sp.]MCB9347347.1 2-oxoacid:acceptor oxidoreductase family protein [Lewinellaceae bacterium]
MLEIRGHARGGQGMVTAFEILAKIFSKLGNFQVQAFPAFGVERTGAPIQAFLRVAKKEILNRSNIYQPNLVVVFDESLLEQVPVFDGLRESGAVLINTERPVEAFAGLNRAAYTVPATRLSTDLGLGSKSLPIVNAAMIGALARIFEVSLEIVQQAIKENVPAKPEANMEAAAQALRSVSGPNGRNQYLIEALHAKPARATKKLEDLDFDIPAEITGLEAPSWSEPLSKNKTGNWRMITPTYDVRPAPCNSSCPAGTDVRGFVRLTSEKRFDEAYELINRFNPFPSICGRVCPNFCEQNCNRNELDRGLNIGAIERFLGDRAAAAAGEEPAEVRHEERVAIIGSGPAGLTAALRLCEKGYATTVFEALPYAGGMMRTGIPRFRLPDEVLGREIQRIEQRGVKIELNKKVSVESLAGRFEAIITATGSHIGSPLRIEGEEFARDGINFLREFKLDHDTDGLHKGQEVAIIGGGNTAIDVARTLLRLGAVPTIYYRRTIREMPAIPQEVKEALLEGVRIEFLSAPVALAPAGPAKVALTLIKMEMGEPDQSGRRRPIPVPGSEQIILVDRVIKAIGQRSDLFALGPQPVEPKQGYIELESGASVFCAGDMAWGGTVAEAIGSGNKVAEEVHAYLRGQPYHEEETLPEVVLPKDINYSYYLPMARHYNKLHHARSLAGDFSEVSKGMDEEEVVAETARCLHCGECFSCGNCYNFCPDAAIHVDEEGRLRIDYDYCKGCGICVQECPCSAMQFQLTEAVL